MRPRGSREDRSGGPGWRLTARRALGLALALSAAFLVVAWAVATGRFEGLDAAVTSWVRALRSEPLTLAMKAVTLLGSPGALVPLGLVASAWVWGAPRRRPLTSGTRHARYGALAVLFALVGSWLLNAVLKSLFQRSRPDILRLVGASGWAFPSGHSMTVFAFYAVTAYVAAATLAARGRPGDDSAGGPGEDPAASPVRSRHPALMAGLAAAAVLLVGLSRWA